MKKARHARAASHKKGRVGAVVAVVLLLAAAAGGTLAWLQDKTEPLQNVFEPTVVTCYVDEEFDGEDKTDVRIQNTGTTAAYIRVTVAANNVDDENKICGLHPALPVFELGENWVKYGNYYYYTLPVDPADYTGIFAPEIELTETDGCCRMRVEIVASAVQSAPAEAVGEAWKVSIAPGSVTAYSAG